MIKRLLCLLLSVLVLLSFAGCADDQEYESLQEFNRTLELDDIKGDEYIEDDYDDVTITDKNNVVNVGYKDAVGLMMKTFDNSFTEEELKAMFPDVCWSWFEKEKGKTFDDIYTDFRERMALNWEKTKESVGEDAAVKYEFVDLKECSNAEYEGLKSEITEKYGVDQASYGKCYKVFVKKVTVGSVKEDKYSQWYHVLQIDDKWYVAEVLTVMPII